MIRLPAILTAKRLGGAYFMRSAIRRSLRFQSSTPPTPQPQSTNTQPTTPVARWIDSLNISNTLSEINKEHDFLESLLNTPQNHEVLPILEPPAEASEENTPAAEPTESQIVVEDLLDTYSIFKELKQAGFTEQQSVVILDLLIEALSDKLAWLQNKFSPKVDLENESYLFQAAQSELLVEMSKNRDSSMNELTNSSIQLKRLFNSLEDELTVQYNLTENTIKMDINQFKHENNLHNKLLNLKNHDLNSKITGEMISGIKSEVESLRWQITMAGIFAILVMVFSLVSGGSLVKFVKGEQEQEELEKQEQEELEKQEKQEQKELENQEQAISLANSTDRS